MNRSNRSVAASLVACAILGLSAGEVKAGWSGSPLGRPEPNPIPAPPINEIDLWRQMASVMLQGVCYLVHCNAESEDPSAEISAFIAAYQAHGIDSTLTPEQRVAARAEVSSAIALVNADPGAISASLHSDLLQTLVDIAADLES